MGKNYYLVVSKINGMEDGFSNKMLGLEDDNIFDAVSEDKAEVLDNISDEVESQINEDSDELFDNVGMYDEENPYDDNYEETEDWEKIEEEDEKENGKKPEDCISLMEIVSGYTNNYRKLFVKIANDTIVEGTGDFRKHTCYQVFEKMYGHIIAFITDKNDYVDNLTKIRSLLVDKKKMVACCGTKSAPFIYEGLQLAYIQQLHLLLLSAPYCLKIKDTFETTIETVGIDKDIKLMNRILGDISDISNLLGNKIKFKDAVKSEITGKSNEINETVYADSDLINEGQDMIVTDFEYSSESIANLIDIKANKSLLEYNLTIRDLSLLMTYLDKIGDNLGKTWELIRDKVYTLIEEEDTSKLDVLLVSTCNDLNPVLLDLNKAYKEILKPNKK